MRLQRYVRAAPYREPRKKVLIVTEGSLFEVAYLKALASGLGLSRQVTVVHAPPQQEEQAAREAQEAQDAIRSRTGFEIIARGCKEAANTEAGYDAVFCLVAQELVLPGAGISAEMQQTWRREAIARCLKTRSGKKVGIILSKPSFDVWLLCHFEVPDSQIQTTADARSELKKAYQQNALGAVSNNAELLRVLIRRISAAMVNAKSSEAETHNAEVHNAEAPNMGPVTEMPTLIARLIELRK